MATWYDLPIEIQDEILEYLFVDVSVIFKENLYQVEEENEIAANTSKRRISDVEPLPDCLSMLLVSKNFVNKRQAAEALLKQAVIGVTSMGDVEGLKSLFSSQQLAFVWKIAIQPPLASGSALSIADSSFQYMLSRGSTSTSVISVLDRVSVAFPNLQVIDYNVSPLRATPDLLNGESAINVALRKVSFNENMQLYYRTKCKKHGKKKLRRFKHPLCIWGADFDRELDFWLRIFAGHVVNNTLVYCTGRDSSSLTPEPRAIFADCALARGIYVNLSVEIQFESVICACFFNLTKAKLCTQDMCLRFTLFGQELVIPQAYPIWFSHVPKLGLPMLTDKSRYVQKDGKQYSISAQYDCLRAKIKATRQSLIDDLEKVKRQLSGHALDGSSITVR